MNAFNEYLVPGLDNTAPAPCLSLYQQTHRTFPQNRQDTVRFANLVDTLQRSLSLKFPARESDAILEPFLRLGEDASFWAHALDGLAVFGAPGFFRTYRFQGSPRELAIAANSFHTKPLLRVMQSSSRFHLLALSRTTAKIFEADQYSIDSLELPLDFPATLELALGSEKTEPQTTVASFGPAGSGGVMRHGHSSRRDEEEIDTEKFFRAVDTAVTRHFSKPSALPLMLVALPEHQGLFRKISRNDRLMKEGIATDPRHLSEVQLKERAWEAMLPIHSAKISQEVERCIAAITSGTGTDDPETAAVAAAEGRVAVLLLRNDALLPGKLDAASGAVTFASLEDPGVDDLLDDIGSLVLQKGGKVLVLRNEEMPVMTGLAAAYRF
ncbi:MAG: hypothetical protein RAO75_04855 [Candidatus Chlorobium antarcticum]|jgi:hypothetical protein|nr:hypothetical protein [Candidatus Chlorobium antarcticum]